jgi:hypothetical protein
MVDATLTGALGNILNGIGAVGALGTAAYGLVDASKALGGGLSNPGFGYIRDAVTPLITVPDAGTAVFGPPQILATLRANWLNGMAKADQKAVAKSLIRLMLKPTTAGAMARATGVNPDHLTVAAQHIQDNDIITDQDTRALGSFDVAVSATLDLGYERGDQFYRNVAKVAAAACAIVLAIVGGWIVYGDKAAACGAVRCSTGDWLPLAILLGLVATPLAPVAKDLSTSLQAAVKAVGVFRR